MVSYSEMSKVLDEIMESEETMEIDEKFILTDEEKYKNYLILLQALRDTEGDTDLNEEWFKYHGEYLLMTHRTMDFEHLENVDTPDEAVMAKTCHNLITQLVNSIGETGRFNVKMYREWCLIIEYFIEKTLPKGTLDEINDIFEKMNIS